MTDPQVALLMLGVFVLTILLGFPIAFTLVAMAMMFGFYAFYDAFRMQHFFDNRVFDLLVNQTYSVMTNEVLVAVPLFLFMGYVVERANIVDRLFYSLNIAARAVPGAMAVAALATCAIFATASGIIGAVVTLMGLLAFPALLKAKYDTKFSAGVICAGGCLGILIPPSIMLIVYAAASGVSVVRLYAGAMLPGMLLAGLYMLYVIGRAMANPKLAPKPPKEETDIPLTALLWMILTSFMPLALLIFAVLGSILFGLATPTEAASMGAFGSLVLATSYRLAEVYDGRASPPWVAEARRENNWLTAVGLGGGIVAIAYLAYVVVRLFSTAWFGVPPLARHLPGAPGQFIVLGLLAAVAIRYYGYRVPLIANLIPERQSARAIVDAVGLGALAGLALGLVYIVAVNYLGLAEILYRKQWSVYGVDVAFIVGGASALFVRGIEWERLKEAVFLTVRTSAMVCWLFVGSWTFSSVFSYLGGHAIIEEFVLGLNLTPVMFLILAQLIIFLLGWPLEWSEIIIIFVPIFLPMLPHFGVDPLFFGILVALNLQTSFMTPPMAMAAYYLKGVAPPHVQLMEIFRGCMPFLFMVLLCMVILYNVPGVVHWLPEYFYDVTPR
ncbi:MAG: TRAP transporter large permease subunit [Kiloniellales bacterium]